MKTKLLYVLVSDCSDVYLEQAHISICSAKYYMPDCHVTLLVDDKTDSAMDDNRKKIVQNVDEYVVAPLPQGLSAHVRSRLLKCGARKYVKGDFLYIDTDTIVVKPLYEIDDVDSSIAATLDSHCLFQDNPYRDMDVALCNKLGFHVEDESVFFNGGVLYVKDNKDGHAFYDMWLDEWKKGLEKGVNKDQPALAKTNSQLGHIVKRIDDTWNCEFIHGMRFLKDAKIVHYLTTNSKGKDKQPFILKDLSSYDLLKKDLDNVKNDFYMSLIKDPFLGINHLTTIVSGSEVYFRRTWLYSRMLEWFEYGKKFNRIQSLLMLISKVKSTLFFWR